MFQSDVPVVAVGLAGIAPGMVHVADDRVYTDVSGVGLIPSVSLSLSLLWTTCVTHLSVIVGGAASTVAGGFWVRGPVRAPFVPSVGRPVIVV